MKKPAVLLVCLMLAFSACGAPAAPSSTAASSVSQSESSGSITFTDALGEEITVENPQRVAALSGSFAETWLLAGGTLACVTQDAFDERGLTLPEGVANAGSLKSPSAEVLLDAGVDFAILSASVSGQVELAKTLRAAGVAAACFDVETFADYLAMLKICTDITGRSDLYAQNGTAVESSIRETIAACAGKEAPTVLLIRAYSTGAKAKNSKNNMTGVMLKELGCENIADSDAALLEDVSMEKILAADPDFIFVTTMGASDEALAALAHSLQANPAWATLTAVKENRYVVLPKDLFHYKPNARWGESYAMLADILYGA